MTIKEFSGLCNCTTQTLRYYDSINLLKPAKVDQFTGYRYYDSEQALDYIKIKNLQDAMFSIEEIKKLLEKDDDEIAKAFDVKIAEQKAKLEKIIQIQMSYQNDYMKMKELVKKTKDKINEGVGCYNVGLEYGITDEYYRAIIEEMNEQYNQAMAELKELGHPGISEKKYNKKADEVMYSDVENPVKDFRNTVVIEEIGWEHTVEILEKMPQLDGEYILYFELKDEKLNFNDFCMVVLHIVQDRNKDNRTKITCTRNRSKDGKNHFWLLKK
jgi:DNA-binding transcriptional MerR regulator